MTPTDRPRRQQERTIKPVPRVSNFPQSRFRRRPPLAGILAVPGDDGHRLSAAGRIEEGRGHAKRLPFGRNIAAVESDQIIDALRRIETEIQSAHTSICELGSPCNDSEDTVRAIEATRLLRMLDDIRSLLVSVRSTLLRHPADGVEGISPLKLGTHRISPRMR